MAPDSGRCSAISTQRTEPLAGSAPVARRWVLIEHPGPWAKQPLDTAPLAGGFRQRLEEAMARRGAKALLMRHTGRYVETAEPLLWRVIDVVTGMAVSGTWTRDRDLDAVIAALDAVAGSLAVPAPEMVLVCTHGTRDACCAIKGRPIVGTLSRAFDDVWECSHLAGHRFAGTALVFPEGACYGRLEQADAVRIVRDHRDGRVDAGRLRGLTALEPAAQAAHVWGLAQVARERPEAPRAVGDVEIGAVAVGPEGRTTVEVDGVRTDDAPLTVTVESRPLPPAPLSCGRAPEEAASHVVVAPPA